MTQKNNILIAIIVLFNLSLLSQEPKLHYNFQVINNSIDNIAGTDFNATLKDGAYIRTINGVNILETGNSNGYLDLGTNTGNLIQNLSDFTISTYVFIDSDLNLSNNGNFIWTFSNSENITTNPKGCFFYSAKGSRYAISLTNYKTESQVKIGTNTAKDSWQHILYRQIGTTGEIYINGVLQKSDVINTLPTALGNTSFNYLARSSYAGDQYLKNSKFSDFRIYDLALNSTEISKLATNKLKLDTLLYADMIDSAMQKIRPENLNAITENLNLTTVGDHGTTIRWQSSNPTIISTGGVVNRPASGSNNVEITLTAFVSKYFISKTISFNATVIAQQSDIQSVTLDSNDLTLTGNLMHLRSNLTLATSGKEGSQIRWTSSSPDFLTNTGIVLKRNPAGSGNKRVILTATISKGSVSTTKEFEVLIAEDEGYTAYLFAYFTGNNISQEAIRFAISNDGLIYNALNNNQPVIASSSISRTGGVRDPHILRGEDGMYYMVVTDMVSANGWNSNRGMVLLKSSNLINWTSSTVHIPTAFPTQFANVDRVWAPQTIYDPIAGKYMIYFSMRKGSSDYDKIYYAYANSSFTALETAPTQLFFHPSNQACIDGDIVFDNGKYHLFFKTEGSGNGIKKAISTNLTGGWNLVDRYLDMNSNSVEGGCVFRLFNTDNWILMYDVYSSGYYEFTTSTDLENFTVINGNSFDFTPRHGTVIPITASEKTALNSTWGETTKNHLVSFDSEKPLWTMHQNNIMIDKPEKIQKLEIFDLVGRKILEITNPTQILSTNFKTSKICILKFTMQSGNIYSDKMVIKYLN